MANDFYGPSKKQKKEKAKRQKKEAQKIAKVNNVTTTKIETVKKVKEKPKKNKLMKIINIILIVIVVLVLFVVTDIVCVTKYNVGPFFAINTKTYEDGGTKVYYGLFYKVIKYKQVIGRKDMVLGSWNMPYSIDPIDTEMLDLAIEFRNNPDKSYKKYAKMFLRLTGTVHTINSKKNSVTFRYEDEDGSYKLDVVCHMYSKEFNFSNINVDDHRVVLGSVSKFKLQTKKSPNTLYLDNCFIN